MFGAGVGAFAYAKLARANGNPNPTNNYIAAGVIGAITFVFFYTLLKWVLHI